MFRLSIPSETICIFSVSTSWTSEIYNFSVGCVRDRQKIYWPTGLLQSVVVSILVYMSHTLAVLLSCLVRSGNNNAHPSGWQKFHIASSSHNGKKNIIHSKALCKRMVGGFLRETRHHISSPLGHRSRWFIKHLLRMISDQSIPNLLSKHISIPVNDWEAYAVQADGS